MKKEEIEGAIVKILIKEGKTLIDEPIIIDGIMNGIYLITLKYDNRVESHRIIKS